MKKMILMAIVLSSSMAFAIGNGREVKARDIPAKVKEATDLLREYKSGSPLSAEIKGKLSSLFITHLREINVAAGEKPVATQQVVDKLSELMTKDPNRVATLVMEMAAAPKDAASQKQAALTILLVAKASNAGNFPIIPKAGGPSVEVVINLSKKIAAHAPKEFADAYVTQLELGKTIDNAVIDAQPTQAGKKKITKEDIIDCA